MQLFDKLKKLPEQAIVSFENPAIPFVNCLLTFFFAISLRTFVESYSQTYYYFNLPMLNMTYNVIHYYLSYVVLALMYICFFHFVTHETIEKTARVVLPAFIVLLITPVLDIIVTKGHGANISYIMPENPAGLLHSYLSYGAHFSGMSFGLRCEILVVLIGCFSYFRFKKISLFLSLFYTWFCYSLIFAWGASPYCVQAIVELFKFDYAHSSIIMIRFFLLEIFLLLILLAYMANQAVTTVIVKHLFSFRFLHWELALLLGCFIALAHSIAPLFYQIHASDTMLINIILSMVSVVFAGVFAFMINIDVTINRATQNIFAYSSATLAILYAAMVNIHAFIIINMLLGAGYIYAESPLCLKRVPIISEMILTVCSLALIILGYLLVQGNVSFFPNSLFLVYLIGGTILLYLIRVLLKQHVATLYSVAMLGVIGWLWSSLG